MPAENNPQRLDSDEAQVQLDEGLRSCRAVVQNYRLMLTGDSGHPAAANDEDEAREPGPDA